MSYYEDEGFEEGFKMSGYEADDTEFPNESETEDSGLEEENPDRDG